MKNKNKQPYFILSVCCALTAGLIFHFLYYIELEGFNPSDDGVILAQSYRIFNGEIPHKDFISIRPVFSGILHGIHFLSPLPLQTSARWFVLFEYFVYSFIWVFLIFKFFGFKFNSKREHNIYFVVFAFIVFLLNVNNYNLFPWTTIDAIFLSLIGLFFLFKIFDKELSKNRQLIYVILSLFTFSLSALSKQNFILPAFASFILVFYIYLKRKTFKVLIFVIFAGALPFIAYLLFLIFNNSVYSFIDQITSRTELVQTGFLAFAKSFINSWMLPVHLMAICGIFFLKIKYKNSPLFKFNKYRLEIRQIITRAYLVFYLLTGIFFSVLLFIEPRLLFQCSFELFWINFVLGLGALMLLKPDFEKSLLIIFSLLISWTSAISLGDNFPVFCVGILGGGIAGIFFLFIKQTGFVRKFKYSGKIDLFIIPLLILFFIIALYGQRKNNYRDLPSSGLHKKLGDLNKCFGRIKTNENTYNYFTDLNSVINQLGGLTANKDRLVVVPNNSIFYPIYKTKNPFPLDWLQHEEYIGSEEFLFKRIKKLVNEREIYIIVDKYDSKRMAAGLKEINISGEKYDYMPVIEKMCVPVKVESRFFRVLKSKSWNNMIKKK